MESEMLKNAAKTIIMPEDMKYRIWEACKNQSDRPDKAMNVIRKPIAAAAVLTVCICLSIPAVAVSEDLRGFFKDITNFCGMVVGTSYEQATDEMDVCVVVKGDELIVEAAFSNPQKPSFEAEKMGIASYQIADQNGSVIKEGSIEAVEIVNGQATMNIELKDISYGSYKLTVTAFTSEKKADQPMEIHGKWTCEFRK